MKKIDKLDWEYVVIFTAHIKNRRIFNQIYNELYPYLLEDNKEKGEVEERGFFSINYEHLKELVDNKKITECCSKKTREYIALVVQIIKGNAILDIPVPWSVQFRRGGRVKGV